VTEQAERKHPATFMSTWGKGSHLKKTEPFEPGTVCGWLTVIEQLTPTSRYTRFRCRCGAEVTRLHSQVRKSMRRGSRPSCVGCMHKGEP
jgi:hypothetical protein